MGGVRRSDFESGILFFVLPLVGGREVVGRCGGDKGRRPSPVAVGEQKTPHMVVG